MEKKFVNITMENNQAKVMNSICVFGYLEMQSMSSEVIEGISLTFLCRTPDRCFIFVVSCATANNNKNKGISNHQD